MIDENSLIRLKDVYEPFSHVFMYTYAGRQGRKQHGMTARSAQNNAANASGAECIFEKSTNLELLLMLVCVCVSNFDLIFVSKINVSKNMIGKKRSRIDSFLICIQEILNK